MVPDLMIRREATKAGLEASDTCTLAHAREVSRRDEEEEGSMAQDRGKDWEGGREVEWDRSRDNSRRGAVACNGVGIDHMVGSEQDDVQQGAWGFARLVLNVCFSCLARRVIVFQP